MRKIERTTRFRRDYKRVAKAVGFDALDALFVPVAQMLGGDDPVPAKYADHSMTGTWKNFRDCHLKPDLVLIYKKSADALCFVRLGSHAELGL